MENENKLGIGMESNHILCTRAKWVFRDKYKTLIQASNPTFRCMTKELKMDSQMFVHT